MNMTSTNTANYFRKFPYPWTSTVGGMVSSIGKFDVILFQFIYSIADFEHYFSQSIPLRHTNRLFQGGRFHMPKTSR